MVVVVADYLADADDGVDDAHDVLYLYMKFICIVHIINIESVTVSSLALVNIIFAEQPYGLKFALDFKSYLLAFDTKTPTRFVRPICLH